MQRKLLLCCIAVLSYIATCLAQEERNDTTIYDLPEQAAEFPGNVYAWIGQHLKYPEICQEQGIQGRVAVQFVINKDGCIADAKALRSPDENLSAEALRLVNLMPKWKPAMHGGKPVRMRYVLPIMFKLVVPEEPKVELANDTILFVPDQSAEFPGDVYKWLEKHIKYPAKCQKKGIQGRVTVQFVINKDGSVTDGKILRSNNVEFSKEALRLLQKMPKWKPAMHGGKPVRMRYVLPITFRLT